MSDRKGNGLERSVKSNDVTNALGFTPLSDTRDMLAYQALGSTIKAETVGFPITACNTASSLNDGQQRYIPVYLGKGATLTGVVLYTRTQGSFTGDNNNKVGLYAISGTNLVKVAESANNENIFKGTANAFIQTAFSTPYVATAGMYFVAVLYNSSAQTTAPALASGTALNNAAMSSPLLTNSYQLFSVVNTQNDLLATQPASGLVATTTTTWAGVY